mgnify:CR=1 FL=1
MLLHNYWLILQIHLLIHLHICEHHHLVHPDVVIHKIVDDLVSVGAVSYLSFSSLHLDGVRKDILLRKVQDLPGITAP